MGVVEGCGRWQVLQATATMGCVARETYSNLINGLSSYGLLYANIIGICRDGGGGGGLSIGCQVSIGAYNMRLLIVYRLSYIVTYWTEIY